MTIAELAFLAAGLLVGAAGGGALATARRHGQARPGVRITISPGAVPRRRAATLATDPFMGAASDPARGGLADPSVIGLAASPALEPAPATGRAEGALEAPTQLTPDRTFVRNGPSIGNGPSIRIGSSVGVPVPIVPEPDPDLAALLREPVGVAATAEPSRADLLVGVGGGSAHVGHDPIATVEAGRGSGTSGPADDAVVARLPGRTAAAAAVERGLARVNQAGPGNGRGAGPGAERRRSSKGPGGRPSAADATGGPCADLDAEAERACRAAGEARERVTALAAELVDARLERDRLTAGVDEAELAADSRPFREERERAQAAFQAARQEAASTRDIAGAAKAWLKEVDRINAAAAAAEARLERERASLEAATATVEHLVGQLDAARRRADAADEACAMARRTAAECAEAAAATTAREPAHPAPVRAGKAPAIRPATAAGSSPQPGPVSPSPAPSSPATPPTAPSVAAFTPAAAVPAAAAADPGGFDSGAGAERPEPGREAAVTPRPVRSPIPDDEIQRPVTAVERMLAGEHEVLREVAVRLGEDEPGRAAWEDRLTAFLEAVLQKAVEAAAVDVPAEHPFWGLFSTAERHDIVSALAALGHHFDGLGGWLDDRWPDQRDLSLAVAHAGLDPMRIREWPNQAASEALLRDAVIRGAAHLFTVAPGLDLEPVRAALGSEAEGLDDVWAAWGRLQPELLATG